jgi:phenylpyruvate tautomerase PptA (4-oxalocrotonate tautomerase family)
MRIVILLVSCSLLLTCASEQTYVPDGNKAQLLSDCTESKAEMLGKPATQLSEKQRRDVLEAATLWAEEAGYFPCDYEMCAALYDAERDSIWVYVTYAETDQIIIGPEARIKLSLPGFRLMDVGTWHSGCKR